MIQVFDDAVKRKYVTYSRTSGAYWLSWIYWVALVGIPIVVVLASPVEMGNVVKFEQPRVEVGYVFVEGLSVETRMGDRNEDGIVDLVTVTGNGAVMKEVFVAIEFIGVDEVHVVARSVSNGELGNKITSWFDLARIQKEADLFSTAKDEFVYDTTVSSLQQALNKLGTNARAKIATVVDEEFILREKFPPVWENVPGSNSMSFTMNIAIPPQPIVYKASNPERLKVNFIFLIAVALLNWLILTTLYSYLVKARVVATRILDPVIMNKNNF